jgi:hypothetical protein
MRKYLAHGVAAAILLSVIMHGEIRAQAVKGQSIRTHTILLGKREKKKDTPEELALIGFIAADPYEKSSPEIKAAFDFLKESGSYNSSYLIFNQLARQAKSLGKFAALWIHIPDTTALSGAYIDRNCIQTLRLYLENGGKVLLSQQAFHLINILGLEPELPKDSTKSCIDDGYGRKLGFHGFREHPLFNGMNGGGYILRPERDLTTRITGYFGQKVPKNGKVIAVDWDYIILKEESKLVI